MFASPFFLIIEIVVFNFVLIIFMFLFITALTLLSFEREPPDNSVEKEHYKTLKYVWFFFIFISTISDQIIITCTVKTTPLMYKKKFQNNNIRMNWIYIVFYFLSFNFTFNNDVRRNRKLKTAYTIVQYYFNLKCLFSEIYGLRMSDNILLKSTYILWCLAGS